MAITIITDPTDAGMNSYCSLAEATAYMETLLYTADWDNATDDEERKKALVSATRLIDTMYDWHGSKYDDDQALRWPRSGVYDQDDVEVDETTIPQFLKDATAEYAKNLLGKNYTADSDTAGLKKIQLSSMSITFDENYKPSSVPDLVKDMLSFYGTLQSIVFKNIRG